MDGKLLIIILALTANPVVAEVYKCADGKYQADPCDEQSVPLDLSGVGSVVTQSSGHQVNQESVDLDVNIKGDTKSASDKKEEISNYLLKQKINRQIKNLEKEKRNVFKDRDEKVEQLRNTGKRANNNLAGATWQQSLAQEMTAVMQQANTEVESIDREIASLKDELKQL